MAKTTGTTTPPTASGQGEGTPAPEGAGDKTGVHDGGARRKIVGDYPERSDKDALSPEHYERLKAAGQEPR